MARAAAKRRQPVRHEADRRRHKDSGGQRFEDTLFFNRLRKRAKWVFVFLAVVFAGGFVLFGVGSSNLGGGLEQLLGRGGSSGLKSINKALKETEKNPKDPKAWKDLATAYDVKGNLDGAILAWTTYTALRPKDIDGFNFLSQDYRTKADQQKADAQAAQAEAVSQQTSTFGPPAGSPLGRALTSVPDPISQVISSSATQRANDAYSAYRETVTSLEGTLARVAALEPTNPSDQLLLADTAAQAGDGPTAIAAYKKFLKLAPDDNSAAYAKQQIKSIQSQLAGAPQG